MPDGKEVKHSGELVLALGEKTGHRHVLYSKEVKVVESNGVIYMSLTIPAPLKHEEHKTIEVPAGMYERVFENEFDYALESIRQVQD